MLECKEHVLVVPQPLNPKQQKNNVKSQSLDQELHQSSDPVLGVQNPKCQQQQKDGVLSHSFDQVMHQSPDHVLVVPQPQSPQKQSTLSTVKNLNNNVTDDEKKRK